MRLQESIPFEAIKLKESILQRTGTLLKSLECNLQIICTIPYYSLTVK